MARRFTLFGWLTFAWQIIEIILRPGSVIAEFTISDLGTDSPTIAPPPGIPIGGFQPRIAPPPDGDDGKSLSDGMLALAIALPILFLAFLIFIILFCCCGCCGGKRCGDKDRDDREPGSHDSGTGMYKNRELPASEWNDAPDQKGYEGGYGSGISQNGGYSQPYSPGDDGGVRENPLSAAFPTDERDLPPFEPEVGQPVMAQYIDGEWHEATVAERAEDGTYGVNWEDGTFSDKIPPEQLRPANFDPTAEAQLEQPPSASRNFSQPVVAGDYSQPASEMEEGASYYSYGTPGDYTAVGFEPDQQVRGKWVEADGTVEYHDARVHSIDAGAGTCMLVWADGSHSEVAIADVQP